MPRKVPTAVAARILGKSENFIRFGLQQGRLPFGSAVKTAKDRWSYHISPLLLANYSGVALGQIITLIEEYGEDKDEEDYEAELEGVIASNGGNDFYEFDVSALRPNEIRWLGKGMLIKPCDGIIQLSYSIHSDHSDGSLQGILIWNDE